MSRLLFALAPVAMILATAPAAADRGPTRAEATAIAASLTAAGFKSWNKIEYDPDGPKWKVDDARKLSDKTYDLQLDAKTYAIVKADGD